MSRRTDSGQTHQHRATRDTSQKRGLTSHSLVCIVRLFMSPKTRFQILLEPEQLAALRRIQKETAAPVASQIRQAVGKWIAEHDDKTERKRGVARKRSCPAVNRRNRSSGLPNYREPRRPARTREQKAGLRWHSRSYSQRPYTH